MSATVTVAGSTAIASTAIAQRAAFYLDVPHLLVDHAVAYTFTLNTPRWLDGPRTLEVEALMSDGCGSSRAAIPLTFSNGVTAPPVNSNSFTPPAASAPPRDQPIVLAEVGGGASDEARADAVVNLIDSWNPDLFLYLGDVYEKGSTTELENPYGTNGSKFSRWRALTAPVIGNDECEPGPTGAQSADGYFDYWNNVPHYSSYDLAGWHFVSLDSTTQFGQVVIPGSPQYEWLRNDLTASVRPAPSSPSTTPAPTTDPRVLPPASTSCGASCRATASTSR